MPDGEQSARCEVNFRTARSFPRCARDQSHSREPYIAPRRLSYQVSARRANEKHFFEEGRVAVGDHGGGIWAETLHSSRAGDEVQLSRREAEEQRLFSTYPLFFRAVRFPRIYPSNIANLGIRCGLGWYSLIEETAHEVELELQAMWMAQIRRPEGLALIDGDLLNDSNGAPCPAIPFCADIRETAGQLQIGVFQGLLCEANAWHRIWTSIENAVRRARSTCECCGKSGELRERYWQHVYCDHCIEPMHFKKCRPQSGR